MSTNAWLQYASTSNKFIQTYVKGFVDMSGGEFIVRNGGNIYLPNNSISDSALSSNVVLINGSNFQNLATFSGGLVVTGGATIDSLNVTYVTIPYLNVSTTMSVPYINAVNITAASMNVASGTITNLNVVNLVSTNLTLPYLNTTFSTMGTLNATSGVFTSNLYVNSSTTQTLFMTIGNGLADVSTNTAIGVAVLGSTTTNATFNTASGYSCMTSLTSGNYNTGMGANALQYNTAGNYNTAVGYIASRNVLGNSNTSCGYNALGSLRYGNNNSAYGLNSLANLSNIGNNTSVCNENSAIGYISGQYDVSGSYNTYLGAYSGCVQNSSKICQYSTAIGYGATIDSSNQIVFGRSSERVYIPGVLGVGKYNNATYLALDISGNVNISGYLLYNLTGTTLSVTTLTTNADSFVNGVRIGMGNSDVSTNTAFGYQALLNNTNGAFNSALGYNALSSNTEGSGNSAMGYVALANNTTGSNNSALGFYALRLNTTGSNNSGLGYQALRYNTTGSNNTGCGVASLSSVTTGSNNTALGYYSLGLTTGSNNTALGNVSGYNVIGSNNTCIGQSNGQLYPSGVVINNSTAIGSNAYFDVSNQIVIGTSAERLYVPGSYVGIGKFAPASGYALDVSGSVNLSGTLSTLYSVNSTKDSFINGARIGMGPNDISTNTIFGYQALLNNNSGAFNSAMGYQALSSNTDGSGNSAFGHQALDFNTTGSNNSGLGYRALYANTTGSNNSALGVVALVSNTTGSGNSGFGYGGLSLNTSGSNNTALGFYALRLNTTGSNNTALGNVSGYNVIGSNNTCIGQSSGQLYASGVVINNSTAIGSNAYFDVSNQIVIGTSAERLYVPGSYVGIGKFAPASGYALDVSGSVNLSGTLSTLYSVNSTKDSFINGARIGMGPNDISTNTIFGYQVLNSNTSGAFNSAMGYQALSSNTDGSGNSAFGYQALRLNTSGGNNSAFGYQVLLDNTTGSNNSAVGYVALANNTTGSNNSAVGYSALVSNTSGSNNTALGTQCGASITTTSNNTFLGYESGYNVIGSNNTCIGQSNGQLYASGVVINNSTAIGSNAYFDVSNQIVIGTSAERLYVPGSYVGIGKFIVDPLYSLDISGNVRISQGNLVVSGTGTSTAWNTWSDYRIKTNINPLSASYVVDNLNPVSYTNKLSNKDEIGFIAHELQQHYPCLVNGEKDGESYQSVNYIGLVPILTREIKEIKTKLDSISSIGPIYGNVYDSMGVCNGNIELPKGNWIVCYQAAFIVESPTLLKSVHIGLGENQQDDPLYSVSKMTHNVPVEIKENIVYSGKMIFSGNLNPELYLINKIETEHENHHETHHKNRITFDKSKSYIKAIPI